MDTVDILQGTSDELLKACNLKAGQIVRIRKSVNGLASTTPSLQPAELSGLQPAEISNGDGDVVLRVVRDFSEMPQVSFDAEIVSEMPEITIPSGSNDESPISLSSDTSPPVAFTTEVVTSNEKWLASFELPKKVCKSLFSTENGRSYGSKKRNLLIYC